MKDYYPLTVYFDASCALCSSEMQAIKSRDSAQQLVLIDCSAVTFDDAPFRNDGITRDAMMDCLHVRDNRGRWIKGVASFELLYRTVGLTSMAEFWAGRFTRPVMERLYPWIARHRQLISRTGLPMLFKLWGMCEARRSYRRSKQCTEGRCSI